MVRIDTRIGKTHRLGKNSPNKSRKIVELVKTDVH